MKVTPRSEEEIQSMNIMPEGVYPFEVTDASDMVSKSGNEMIMLTLAVYDGQNRKHVMKDFLLDAMAFKIRHFCEFTGILDRYNLGKVNAQDCYRKAGYAKVVVEAGRERPDGGEYPPRNAIKDYCARPEGKAAPEQDGAVPFNDDCPF